MSQQSVFFPILPEIESQLLKFSKKAYSERTLSAFLKERWSELQLPEAKTPQQLIDFLIRRDLLKINRFKNEKGTEKEILSWKTEDEYTIFTGLKNQSYFTHFSALFLNELTLQIPKTHYLNVERAASKNQQTNTLAQDAIDRAFSKEQRKANHFFSIPGRKVYVLNGQHTDRLGVAEIANEKQYYAFTDVERTLIDSSIRPAYAGGIFEVLNAYKVATDRVDPEKLADYLQKLDFIYPYNQVIGFYLEKAGYPEEAVSLFDVEKEFDFYLTYNIRKPQFDERWRLFYPRGFD